MKPAVYTSSKYGDSVIVLEFLPDTKTNMDRENISDCEYATYRADKLLVKQIYNKKDKSRTHTRCLSDVPISIFKYADYVVGEIITSKPIFNIENNNSPYLGITFFLNEERAYHQNITCSGSNINYNLIKNWYDNGNLEEVTAYKNYKKHGRRIYYNYDGSVCSDVNYIDGVEEDVLNQIKNRTYYSSYTGYSNMLDD